MWFKLSIFLKYFTDVNNLNSSYSPESLIELKVSIITYEIYTQDTMNKPYSEFIIFCDGGARGNPGEAAYAFIITDFSGKEIYSESKKIGISTNNTAEYKAVIAALGWIVNNKIETDEITFNLDSQLVAMQLNGKFRVKSETIRGLYFEVKKLEEIIPARIFYRLVPREKNVRADILVNIALDTL